MEENLPVFIECLAQLNRELKDLSEQGDIAKLADMHATVKKMYRLQHGSEEESLHAIDPDCEIIYRNFDMILAVLKTTEGGVLDRGTQVALNKFLHNINEALINIVTLFGLV